MNKENQRGLSKQRIQGDKKSRANVAPVVLGEKRSPSSKEQYQLYMKYIISTNSEYFQNKSKAEDI